MAEGGSGICCLLFHGRVWGNHWSSNSPTSTPFLAYKEKKLDTETKKRRDFSKTNLSTFAIYPTVYQSLAVYLTVSAYS